MSGLKLAGLAAALALVTVSAAAAAAAGPANRANILRAQAATLGARAHQATLDLYALASQLDAARARLGSLQAEATRLRSQQALLAQQIVATRRTLVVSQRQLGANLRLLYEQGDTDPIAVMLGAQSIQDAMSRLDDLQRTADQSRRFVVASTYAQIRLVRLRTTLAAHRARIAAAVASAQRTAEELAATRAARAAFVDRLRNEQRLKTAQIRTLEAIVQRAEVKSQALSAAAAVAAPVSAVTGDPPPAPAGQPSPPPAQTTAPSSRTLTVVATAYSLPGRTATGLPVGWGVVAVDPTVIPLGTRMTVPGYGEAVAADVGAGVRGATIDLWFPSLAQALAWGRRTVTITLH